MTLFNLLFTTVCFNDFQILTGELCLTISILYLLVYISIYQNDITIKFIFEYVISVLFLVILVFCFNGYIWDTHIIFNGFIMVNPFISISKAITLFFIMNILFISFNYAASKNYSKDRIGVYGVLILLVTLFACFLLSSYDFVSLYLSLEGVSLSLFILIFINPRSHTIVESGVKYFSLSVFTSCFLLFGISLLYAITGSTNFIIIRSFFEFTNAAFFDGILSKIAILFIIGSFLFKLGAAPFHMWIAEVYAGIETPTTTFMIVSIKFVFFIVLLKLLGYTFYFVNFWKFFILLSSVLSIVIGCFGAIYQDDLKKFSAFTSVNQMGFLLFGLSNLTVMGFSASFLNLVFYSLANVGFFLVILNSYNTKMRSWLTSINQLKDFSTSNLKTSYMFSILILSMAGIPPLMGFWGKFLIFLSSDFFFTAVLFVGLLTTVISAFYYVRLIKNSFFDCIKSEPFLFPYTISGLTINLSPQMILNFIILVTVGGCFFLNYIYMDINYFMSYLFFPFSA